jgi:hypothetical protein
LTGPDDRLYVGIGISGHCSDEYLDESYPFERRRGRFLLFSHEFGDLAASFGNIAGAGQTL